jgi:hypothetical protein
VSEIGVSKEVDEIIDLLAPLQPSRKAPGIITYIERPTPVYAFTNDQNQRIMQLAIEKENDISWTM